MMIEPNQTVEAFLSRIRHQSINWDAKPDADRWSRKEIIGHLIDSAQINLQRFVRCTYEENFKLIYFQNEYVAAQHYQEADIQELLDLWRLLNRQISRVLHRYPTDRINALCDNARDGVNLMTVAILADDYLAHMNHHLAQILQAEF